MDKFERKNPKEIIQNNENLIYNKSFDTAKLLQDEIRNTYNTYNSRLIFTNENGVKTSISVKNTENFSERKITFSIKKRFNGNDNEVLISVLSNGAIEVNGKIMPKEKHKLIFSKIREKINEYQNYKKQQEKKETQKELEKIKNM